MEPLQIWIGSLAITELESPGGIIAKALAAWHVISLPVGVPDHFTKK